MWIGECKLRESTKASLGGIIAALSIVIMLLTYVSPLLVYTAPPFAGILLLIIINELGFRWSVATFAAVSLLSVFIIADKEAAVFYTMFFGYYPILVTGINKAVKNKLVNFVIKFFVCNIACIISIFVCTFFFGVSYDDIFSEGLWFIIAFILLMNVFFVIYDNLITKLQLLYVMKIQKKIRKLFNIR